jgi:non-specific serine/threonine protein kinase
MDSASDDLLSSPLPRRHRFASIPPVPVALTQLVGRERELALAMQLLQRETVRLLTVTGPGGIGKTRLATEIASAAEPDYPDGVAFVPLDAVTDTAGIVSAIIRALGLPDAFGVAGEAGLIAALRPSAALIVLDNFEHLLPAAPLVATLLAACPRLNIMVTSRSLLRIAGEYALPVPPLVLPGHETPGSWEEIAGAPAVQLFVERVQATAPGFVLSEQNAAAVAGICRLVDGLPLAIELAAAQVTVLPPAALLARIQARLPLPVPGPRDAPVRLRTIRDAVGWSYDLLTAEEQRLFRQLGIFAGGFTADAADAVVSPSALAGIASLVEKNLLQPAGTDGASRFAMLETIRSFAREQLEAHGEQDDVAAAHAAWALALAEPAEFATAYPGHEGLLHQLEIEHANLLAAMTWLDRTGDDLRLLRFCAALGQFWMANGHVREARDWLERALERADSAPPALRSRAQLYLGRIYSYFGDVERADALMAACIADLHPNESPLLITVALFHRGAVANQAGEYDRAEQFLDEAYRIASAIPDPTVAATATASVLANLGVTAQGRGDLATARERYVEALTIYREHAFAHGAVRALCDLGDVDRDQGEFVTSVAWYRECIDLLEDQLDSRILTDALGGIALAAAAWRQPVQAARLLGAAEALRERYGGAFIALTDRHAHDRTLAAVRSTLGEPELTAAWQAGRRLSIAEMITEARAISPGPPGRSPAAQPAVKLSQRELEVLTRLAAGASDRAIADELFLSVRTVEAHVAHILAKFDVRTRAAAASAALAGGIIPPESAVPSAPIG